MNKDKIEKILKDLDFDDIDGKIEGNKFTFTLKNSDDYAYYYTLLDQNDDLTLIDSSSVSTEYLSVIKYEGENFKVSLNADYNKNYYNITIEDLK